MGNRRAAVAALAGLLAGGCAGLRWKGNTAEPPAPRPLEPLQVAASSGPAKPLPIPARDPEADTLYYSDLGVNAIDVSGYPAQQQYNYKIYADVCARCHSLARSINAPVVSRGFWEFYISRMRLYRTLARQTRLKKQESKAVIDFLDFDSQARKIAHKQDFERQQDVLKDKFDVLLRDRLERMQNTDQPELLRQDQP